MRLLLFILILSSALSFSLLGQEVNSTLEKHLPSKTQAVFLGEIPALTSLTPHTSLPYPAAKKQWKRPNNFFSNPIKNQAALPQNGDPLIHKNAPLPDASGPQLIPGLNFEGLYEGNVTPPDPTGDVGLNHYVQSINNSGGAWFQVWDKQGQSVYGPALTSTIWSQVNSGSIGDPIIQYDHAAQRWLLMEMQGFSENQLLIAVSNTSDPTGGWKAWRIQCMGFPDYPKLYVWDNSYFVTVNEIVNSNKAAGYALNKSALLNGAATVDAYRFEMPNFLGIQYQPLTGADWEGGPPPPPGSPGLILRVYDDAWDGGSDAIQLWQIFVDWDNQAANYAFGPTSFNVAPFETRVCWGGGLFDCIEQPGTSNRITALENIIMYRAPYRNFGTHESVVFNHVTDASNQVGDGGDAAVRWYEMRKNAGETNWFIYQQGTYAPDNNNRFTGTLSMDVQGNIGMGYSTVSEITFPGIRFTGRRTGDPLGEMPVQEYTLVNGGKSHLDDNRWGDYSSMSVDPVDGKTFWFTAEYQPADKNWGTRIGTFQVRRDTYDIAPTEITDPKNSALLNSSKVTVKIFNGGIKTATNCSADLFVDNVLLATENIPATILSGESATHTFLPNVTWVNYNDKKNIRVVTHWNKDEFTQNDTLKTSVKKLTAFDAAYGGAVNLPNFICTSDYPFKIALRNAAGLPLDSVQIRWKINQQPFQTRKWYGHLLPGEQDTITFDLNGLSLVQNLFVASIILPNGQPDQDSTNNKIQQKVITNLNGTYLTAKCKTTLGVLKYELKLANNSLLDQGLFTLGSRIQEICSTDGTCYQLITRSTTFKWEGTFELFDIYGNSLATITKATPQPETNSVCVPLRKSIDIGAFSLINPKTGPNLSASEPVSVEVKNFGTKKVGNIDVSWRPQGGNWTTQLLSDSIPAGTSKSFLFSNSTANAPAPGLTYIYEIKATVAGDEITANDSRLVSVTNKVQRDIALIKAENNLCSNPSVNFAEITLENTGLTTIDSCLIQITLNGVDQSYSILTPDFAPGQTINLFQDLPAAQFGLNQVNLKVIGVNDLQNDDYVGNNQSSFQFNVDKTKSSVNLFISLDGKPKETFWELKRQNGTMIASGGDYEVAFDYIFDNFCLDNDSCYVFTLKDSGSNGLSNASARLTNYDTADPLIWQFNNPPDVFTDKITVPFCVFDKCSGLSITTEVTNPTNASMDNGKIKVTASGGKPLYRYSINGGTPQLNTTFIGLSAGIYTVKCEDDNLCETITTAVVGTVATQSPNTPQRQITLTPNPTRGPVWLSMPAGQGEIELTGVVTNLEGKLIREIILSRFDNDLRAVFSLQNQPAGFYIVTIMAANGSKIAEKRVIKI